MGKLFGTDGVRGEANTELTPELAYNLGRAGAFVLAKENKKTPNIMIGMDTRISGDMLEAALTAGMCSVGANVVIAGVIPTPAIAYLTKKYGLDAGVAVSASHNPFGDNGIKFFDGNGYKLKDESENEIEDIILKGKLDSLPRASGGAVGRKTNAINALSDYTEFLKSILGGVAFDGMKVAVDCANGATYQAAPELLCSLGAEVSVLNDKPDGKNINLNCGSTHIGGLISHIKDHDFDIGVAFDGDGDRLIAVDENGEELDGDQIMSICGNYMKQQGRLVKNTIVATVMSNLGMFIMGEKMGINIEKTVVGDRYVLERMLEGGFVLGGEQSGHIIFLEHTTTGDGILSAIQLMRIMKQTGKKLSELGRCMDKYPQVLVNARVSNKNKHSFLAVGTIKEKMEQLEKKYTGKGRVLIRPSGTEPLIRVTIEGRELDEIRNDAKEFACLLEEQLNAD